jgi:hypothetical protein
MKMNRTSRCLRSLRFLWQAATIAGPLAAGPAAADTIVYPTGSYPADVENVQAAVDGGGIVRLLAVNEAGEPTVFDFGPPVAGSGFVLLSTDVEIRGETQAGGRTTIRGGNAPIRGEVAIRCVIDGIYFDRPRVAAIFLAASSGAVIMRNVITGVVGFPFFPPGSRKAQGVWIIGEPSGDGPVTGTITIAHNTIADIDADDGVGLTLLNFEADIKILGNDIRGTNAAGIVAFAHSGGVWIQDNVIIPGPERFPFPELPQPGIGIQVGPLRAYIADPTGPTHISNNRIVCENPLADGIAIFGFEKPFEGSVITGNRVTMKDSLFGGITLIDNVSNTEVSGNEVDGSGAYALDVIGLTPGVPNPNNHLAGNRIAGFDATIADVFLDESTSNTLVAGCHGTVIDRGTDNRIVGCDDSSVPAADRPPETVGPRERRLLGSLAARERDLADIAELERIHGRR